MLAVKKLVEKASIKKPGGNSSDGLKASDVDPRLLFHNGVPCAAANFAYDNAHMILAISTKDGRIKLYGKGNSQALLESTEPLPSKFLQVWDIDKKLLSDAYIVKEEITSFAVIQHSLYMYIGYSNGDISVLKIDQEPLHVVQMQYTIPLSASYGNSEVPDDNVVTHILPQPAAESKRVLIIFRNGQIVLWDIRESKTVFKTGGTKKVSSACWSCPFGSKVVVGYNNGEIFIWSIPSLNVGRDGSASAPDHNSTQNTPLLKLNLGYKSEKISIGSMKWIYAEGKAARLYVMGDSDNASSSNSLQVVLLNDNIESRTIKMGLHLSECCVAMEIISASSNEQSKHRQESLILIGKSGHIYQYDDGLIERYLIQQSQSKSSPSLPKEVTVKLPFADSSIITTSKFISNTTNVFNIDDEYYRELMKNYPPLVMVETNVKDVSTLSSTKFTGFSKVQNLYITGHNNGAINFWDASCPLFIPILQLKQQSENDFSLSGIPLTALFFDSTLPLLVSGDQSGTVRLFRFKPEPYTTNSFMSLTGGSKKGTDHIIQSVKVVKTNNGAVLSMNINHSSTLLAVGSDQGHVSVFSMDGPTLLYQKSIASEISAGIVDLQFLTCSLQGFEKNILAVGTKDSSVLALDSETGNTLGNGSVHPKKLSRALFMQVFGSNTNTEESTTKQSHILLCSEKALYVYSLVHAVQGIKKVLYKKKFHSSSCCWASTFHSNDDIGLMLLFSNGKLELRSLPELSLIVETCIRGFNYSPPKLGSFSDTQMCCSSRGDLVLVNGDQEIFVFSTLVQSINFRLLDSVSTIYSKERMASQEELVPGQAIHKEKKKGIFSSVIKDLTGGKEKHAPIAETEDSKESIQELSVIFSNPNFPSEADNHDNLTADEDDVDLNIDDIDIDDHEEKHKEQNRLGLGALNKKKLAGKFNALKGKLKEMKGNIHKASAKEEQQEEQAGTVDQIKKKYGFSSYSSSDVSNIFLNMNLLEVKTH
ncbi:hypothetical protein PIB30_059215 [Stylosanthes scabra]|uniref:Lethal giant larvae (Lgl)-like C-terminal domain-containing protein n=1 Tax=Stylosanthes scabra TaxID=79078 RepID=A0ABU6QJW3_9FABA|nr:hypothetical protein [Stylosanthes scabra]